MTMPLSSLNLIKTAIEPLLLSHGWESASGPKESLCYRKGDQGLMVKIDPWIVDHHLNDFDAIVAQKFLRNVDWKDFRRNLKDSQIFHQRCDHARGNVLQAIAMNVIKDVL